MKLNTNKKSLTVINENSILNKFKSFFRKIIGHKYEKSSNFANNPIRVVSNIREEFNESLKSNLDTSLIDLQIQLKQEKIEVDDLTNEEVDKLIELYEKQIAEKKSELNIIKSKIISIKKSLKNS